MIRPEVGSLQRLYGGLKQKLLVKLKADPVERTALQVWITLTYLTGSNMDDPSSIRATQEPAVSGG